MVPRSDQALTVFSAILNETPLTRWIGAPEVRFPRETQEVKNLRHREQTGLKGSVQGECTHICFPDP